MMLKISLLLHAKNDVHLASNRERIAIDVVCILSLDSDYLSTPINYVKYLEMPLGVAGLTSHVQWYIVEVAWTHRHFCKALNSETPLK